VCLTAEQLGSAETEECEDKRGTLNFCTSALPPSHMLHVLESLLLPGHALAGRAESVC